MAARIVWWSRDLLPELGVTWNGAWVTWDPSDDCWRLLLRIAPDRRALVAATIAGRVELLSHPLSFVSALLGPPAPPPPRRRTSERLSLVT